LASVLYESQSYEAHHSVLVVPLRGMQSSDLPSVNNLPMMKESFDVIDLHGHGKVDKGKFKAYLDKQKVDQVESPVGKMKNMQEEVEVAQQVQSQEESVAARTTQQASASSMKRCAMQQAAALLIEDI